MTLDPSRRREVGDLAEVLLDGFEKIAGEARGRLFPARATNNPAEVLAFNSNQYVHGQSSAATNLASRLAQAREQLQSLLREPYIARVVVKWAGDESPSIIYMCRGAASDVSDAIPGSRVVSYRAPLGRLAEFEPGDEVTLPIANGTRRAEIIERARVRPRLADGSWDAFGDSLEFSEWKVSVDSLRSLLREASELLGDGLAPDILGDLIRLGAEAQSVRDRMRRRVIDRMSLRDQPILDQYQGEIFRMPLNSRLLLFGAPGTGKTTTLIRRLAQKRTQEALSEDELDALASAGVAENSSAGRWAMYSPTDLLKLYLREAFNREAVPAGDANLRTWGRHRLDLARNVLGILRSGESGRFQLDETAAFLSDQTSAGSIRLFEAFATAFEESVLLRFSESVQELSQVDDPGLRRRVADIVGRVGADTPPSIDHLVRVLDRSADLQPDLKKLDERISESVREMGNSVLFKHKELLDEIVALVPQLSSEDRADDEDDDGEEMSTPAGPVRTPEANRLAAAELFIGALRRLARGLAMGRKGVTGRSGRVLDLVGDRIPPRDGLLELGKLIVSRAQLRILTRSPREFVMGAPTAYSRFRSGAVRDTQLYAPNAGDAVKQWRLSPPEADVIVLAMLRNARRLLEAMRWRQPSQPQEWLEGIRAEHLTQVFVDEATDFSAVQLACTIELAHPRLRSWFACGDPDQRITEHGLSDPTEVEWLARTTGKEIERRQIRIAYRQSRRLRELASALSQTVGAVSTTDSPDWADDAAVPPLLAERHVDAELANWLSKRIAEIESATGDLPSIAVFVDGEARIDPLVSLLQAALADRNLRVVACRDGRDVGDDLEVRVFDIRHIKGLEFEAVFLIGVDQLAERLPGLFDRYVYVGASRAATYLGITCEGPLPSGLERVRGHFEAGPW